MSKDIRDLSQSLKETNLNEDTLIETSTPPLETNNSPVQT